MARRERADDRRHLADVDHERRRRRVANAELVRVERRPARRSAPVRLRRRLPRRRRARAPARTRPTARCAESRGPALVAGQQVRRVARRPDLAVDDALEEKAALGAGWGDRESRSGPARKETGRRVDGWTGGQGDVRRRMSDVGRRTSPSVTSGRPWRAGPPVHRSTVLLQPSPPHSTSPPSARRAPSERRGRASPA